MSETQEWKDLAKRVLKIVRKVVDSGVEKVEENLKKP